jgi:hypothetical protein
VLDREAPGFEVRIGRPVDIELLGSPRLIVARPSRHPVTDRRCHLRVVDETETLVALANPFTQERKQQSVPLGGAGVESTDVRSRRISSNPGIPMLTVMAIPNLKTLSTLPGVE